MIRALTALLCGFLVGESLQTAPDDSPASLQTACDAGTPLACYQLALRYRDGVGVEKSRELFEALVLKACKAPIPRGMPNGIPPGIAEACFTACIEAVDERCPGLETNPPMWQAMREYIKAPDTAARLRIVATTRDLFFVRWVQGCRYDECKSLPDLETLLEATRARVREIALTDPDPGNRSFAVRDGELRGVRGEDLLQIAKNDPDPMVRKSAEEKVFRLFGPKPWEKEGAAELVRMSKSRDVETRRRAVEKLMDPARLAEMAEKDKDRSIREHAVSRLGDYADDWQPVLIRIAERDKDDRIRSAAAARVKDQQALERLLRGSRITSVRRHALENLEGKTVDMSLLLWVAEHDSDDDIRGEAASRIIDQGVLAGLARSNRSHQVRARATAKLKDQKLLGEIAVRDPVDWVYKAAIDTLQDGAILAEVARRRPEEYVLQLIIQKTSDQELLATLARTAGSWMVRFPAVGKLTDQKVLEEIARTDTMPAVREAAQKRLAALRTP
jgi:hypothetical protein